MCLFYVFGGISKSGSVIPASEIGYQETSSVGAWRQMINIYIRYIILFNFVYQRAVFGKVWQAGKVFFFLRVSSGLCWHFAMSAQEMRDEGGLEIFGGVFLREYFFFFLNLAEIICIRFLFLSITFSLDYPSLSRLLQCITFLGRFYIVTVWNSQARRYSLRNVLPKLLKLSTPFILCACVDVATSTKLNPMKS